MDVDHSSCSWMAKRFDSFCQKRIMSMRMRWWTGLEHDAYSRSHCLADLNLAPFLSAQT